MYFVDQFADFFHREFKFLWRCRSAHGHFEVGEFLADQLQQFHEVGGVVFIRSISAQTVIYSVIGHVFPIEGNTVEQPGIAVHDCRERHYEPFAILGVLNGGRKFPAPTPSSHRGVHVELVSLLPEFEELSESPELFWRRIPRVLRSNALAVTVERHQVIRPFVPREHPASCVHVEERICDVRDFFNWQVPRVKFTIVATP